MSSALPFALPILAYLIGSISFAVLTSTAKEMEPIR